MRGMLRRVSDNDMFLLLLDNNMLGYDYIVEDVDEIENIVVLYGRRLIDFYFWVVYLGFFII